MNVKMGSKRMPTPRKVQSLLGGECGYFLELNNVIQEQIRLGQELGNYQQLANSHNG